MCGIAGVVAWGQPKGSLPGIGNLLEALVHRGPDESISWEGDSEVVLGMTRLAIQDLHGSLYPVMAANQTIVAVFNGEIYNHTELRNELQDLGFRFPSMTDGEVISAGYAAWGTGVFARLEGMFAIALWDARERKLVLARDRLGIKPLFYRWNDGQVIFASEALPLMRFCRQELKDTGVGSISDSAVRQLYGRMFLPPSEDSAYDGIKQVAPGAFWEMSSDFARETHYWTLPVPAISGTSLEDAAQTVDLLLMQSMKSHLRSDVPVAIALSGGMDSGLLATLATRLNQESLTAFTATFPNDSRSEEIPAKHLAESLGLPLVTVPISAQVIAENWEEYTPIFGDLSTLDGGAITTMLLSQEMRKNGFPVALFGEGADELFGGYTWFGLSQGVYRWLPKGMTNRLWSYANTRDRSDLFPGKRTGFARTRRESSNTYDWIFQRELTQQLPAHLLAKVDRGTSAASVEGRVPYLDAPLVNYVAALPTNIRTPALKYGLLPDASATKPLLRAVANRHLDESLRMRPKKGFMLPIDTIVEHSHDRIRDLLSSQTSLLRNCSEPELWRRATRMLDAKATPSTSRTWMLWRTLVLESVGALK